ncbi:MAG: rhodanese-like domain-containing protein [Nitriliruptorales bacterium]|nr:rhodanese-like domain-containing protein [Nitriliruptorales bacterium]
MAPEVDIQHFAAAHADGGVVIDVREPFEYAQSHIPQATLLPLGEIPHRTNDLPADERVYVVCATGNRSLTAANFLRRAGIDAVSVAGGTAAWERAGHPVVVGQRAA